MTENINFSTFRNHSVLKVEVPAGVWISRFVFSSAVIFLCNIPLRSVYDRFLADSYQLTNFLCHTLVTNVSVDLGKKNGNTIRLVYLQLNCLSSRIVILACF